MRAKVVAAFQMQDFAIFVMEDGSVWKMDWDRSRNQPLFTLVHKFSESF